MRIIDAMILPGGWHFKDVSGYRVPHKGELPNPKEVVDAILTYRLENRIPVGNPQQDFELYVCENFPAWCQPEPHDLVEAANIALGDKAPVPRQVDIVTSWATTLYEHAAKLQLVPLGESEKRSEACRECPHNVPWEGDCPPCVTNAQRLLMIVRQGREVSAYKKLHLCGAWKFDTRTAVHLDRQHFGNDLPPALPSNCWLK